MASLEQTHAQALLYSLHPSSQKTCHTFKRKLVSWLLQNEFNIEIVTFPQELLRLRDLKRWQNLPEVRDLPIRY